MSDIEMKSNKRNLPKTNYNHRSTAALRLDESDIKGEVEG
jgi:hypothetical protein